MGREAEDELWLPILILGPTILYMYMQVKTEIEM